MGKFRNQTETFGMFSWQLNMQHNYFWRKYIQIWSVFGWWFQIHLIFHPYLVIWSSYLTNMFQMGWNHFPIFPMPPMPLGLRTVEATPEKKIKISESSASAPSAATTASSDVSGPIFVWCGSCGQREQDLSIYIYIQIVYFYAQLLDSSEIWNIIYTYLRSTWLSYRCILMVVCNVFESNRWGPTAHNSISCQTHDIGVVSHIACVTSSSQLYYHDAGDLFQVLNKNPFISFSDLSLRFFVYIYIDLNPWTFVSLLNHWMPAPKTFPTWGE